jgi:hypothetical protein
VKTLTRREAAELFLSFRLSMAPARAVLFIFGVIETNVLRESWTSEFSHSLDPELTLIVLMSSSMQATRTTLPRPPKSGKIVA